MDGSADLALHPPGDYVSDAIRTTGRFFEADILEAIAPLVDGPVVDAGAMIGNHTVFFARLGHTVTAFEPLRANLDLLYRNVGPYPDVTVHPVALSNAEGWAAMTVEPENYGHARLVEGGPERVFTQPLDWFELAEVALLKIDVEGHESEVLEGAAETIARCRPLILIEDWHGAPDIEGYRLAREWERSFQTFLYEPAP